MDIFEISTIILCIFMIFRVFITARYIRSTTTKGSRLNLDFFLSVLNFVCGVILPLLWGVGGLREFDYEAPIAMQFTGLLFYGIGFLLMCISHYYLGKHFSGIAEIKKDHTLVTSGVYKYVRHPMYTAFYILVLGIFLVSANLLVGVLSVLLWHFQYKYRVVKEEAYLLEKFGEQYKKHMIVTGRLFPRLKTKD
jgi:protein-S-isoprenylcysteine O-methyltransferase Ste14